MPERTFYGVRVENLDQTGWDWLDRDGLLWVFDNGQHLEIWQESRQRPRVVDGIPDCGIERIVGHYQDESGRVYYGVKWLNYESPSWELEEDLERCSDLLTRYCESSL
jgi:hypothetical protein